MSQKATDKVVKKEGPEVIRWLSTNDTPITLLNVQMDYR
jgi:hypothetical protein